MTSARREARLPATDSESRVDELLMAHLRDALLTRGLRPMHVGRETCEVLSLLIRLSRPQRLLEVGSYFGWSAANMARSLGETAELVTIERDPDYCMLARRALDAVPGGPRSSVIEADAEEWLDEAASTGERFDFIFIDAEKRRYPAYLALCYPLLALGGILVADDCGPGGDYSTEPGGHEAAVLGARRYMAACRRSTNLESWLVAVDHGLFVSRRVNPGREEGRNG